MKLSPCVSFINVLLKVFVQADPKKRKKYGQAISLFCAFEIWARKSFE